MKLRYFFIGMSIFLLVIMTSQDAFSDSLLSWDQSADEVTGYRIYYSQVQGEYADTKDVGNVTTYSLDALPLNEGVTYYLIVRAYNSAGESGNSNEVSYIVLDNTPPAQPQGVAADNEMVSLAWNGNVETDLKEYRVYYGKAAGSYGPFIPVGKVANYTFANLEKGTRYYCAVTAVDQAGNESGYSGSVILTTPSDLESPTIPQESGPVLSWTQSSGTVTGYRVYYGTAQGSYPNSWNAGNTTQVALSALQLEEGKTYYFVVRAYNDSGESENSDSISWVTKTTPTVDNTKPTISIVSPTNTAWFDTEASTINFSGTASDNTEVTQVVWSNSRGGNGNASGANAWTISGVSLAEGENVLTLTAKDAAGNLGSQVLIVLYTIPDTTSPVGSTPSSDFEISNLSVASGKPYQIKQNLVNGSSCYIDRPYVYRDVPSYLLESMYIQTANGDKQNTGSSFLSFDINIAATVYVIYDDRYDIPSWLSGFTKTGDTLRTESLMNIFSKDYGPGRIILGGNGHGGNHYTVMAVKKTGGIADVDLAISNITAASGKPYPLKQGLANGSPCYIDRSYVYSNIPSYLMQSMYIQTANNDKLSSGSIFLSFDINTAAMVYVVFDDRYDIPSWLSDFTQTGDTLRTESLMNIFSKEYAAGRIILGGNGHKGNHYTVMVVKKTVVVKDLELPKVYINTPTSNAAYETNKSSIGLAGRATDNVEIVKVSWKNIIGSDSGAGGEASGTDNWSIPTISLIDGDNNIVVTALDSAGNQGVAVLKVAYTPPDIEKPVISIQKPASGGISATFETQQPTIDIAGVASDDSGEITRVRWVNSRGGSGIASGMTTWSIPGVSLAEGENLITLTAEDAAGNLGSQVLTVLYTIPDTTLPVGLPPSSDLEISNLTVASGRSYRIMQGLSNGSSCYIDRPYVYSYIPTYLIGSDYIQTANGDKQLTEGAFLSFYIDASATVYVAYDDRYGIPSWLSGFIQTGDTLGTDSLMKIFSKEYGAGRVVLGGNGNSGNHYTVMVVQKTVAVNLEISNLRAASGKSYEIKSNLANGSSCYIDRSYVYRDIPSYLLESIYIQPANNDKQVTGSSFLSFDINTSATVYVVYDDRYDIPSWLSGFTNTGDRLRTESLMKIFSKDYGAGRVSLGGNGHGGNHYTVIVVEK